MKEGGVDLLLARFFATGDLGPIRLGMSPEEVEMLLGPPEGLGLNMPKGTILWKHGDLELIFVDGKLWNIALHFYNREDNLLLPNRLHSAPEAVEIPGTITDL